MGIIDSFGKLEEKVKHTKYYKCRGRRYPVALSFSAGFDSTVTYLMLRKEYGFDNSELFIYFVDYGQPYAWKEVRQARALAEKYKFSLHEFNIKLLSDVFDNKPTLEESRVNGRNILLVYIGAMFGDIVLLGANAENMNKASTDKNQIFFNLINNLFSYSMYDVKQVGTILEDLTKSQMLQWVRKNYNTMEAYKVLKDTVSCYDEVNEVCNNCGWCLNKWVMITNNGLDAHMVGLHDTWQSERNKGEVDVYLSSVAKNQFTIFNRQRCMDFVSALHKKGVDVNAMIARYNAKS